MFDYFGKNWGKNKKQETKVENCENFAHQFLCGISRPDPLFKKAYQAWLSYYDQLEEYEQKICQARTPEGVALPRAGDELRLCAQKGRLLRQELIQPLIELNIPAHTESSARDLALREHHRKWKLRNR